jgi:hypothetical protein
MQALRLAVATMLCYGGAHFIAHTIALNDLILNCIALGVRRISLPPAGWCAFLCPLGMRCVPSIRHHLPACSCAGLLYDRVPTRAGPAP